MNATADPTTADIYCHRWLRLQVAQEFQSCISATAGRLFYVCCRADGPPPHGRCDYFVWASNREVRGSQISKTKSGGAAKQR